MILLEILGKPQGKARPRFRRMGNYVRTYNTKEDVKYEEDVKQCFKNKYRDFEPLQTSLKCKIKAIFEVPQSYSNKKKRELLGQPYLHKPDVDNIVKIILDSLNGLAYKDDMQVWKLEFEKAYGEEEKVIVEIVEV